MEKIIKPYDNWERYLEASLKQQERISKRIVRLRKIIEMRKSNKFTIEDMGRKLGVSKQAVSEIIKKFKL